MELMMKLQQVAGDVQKLTKENGQLKESFDQEKEINRKKDIEIENVRQRLSDIMKSHGQMLDELNSLRQEREKTQDQQLFYSQEVTLHTAKIAELESIVE